ncbi:MAG: hypothetical protein CMP70_02025 [Flavobacteriales bacterium]|nr:hypothetical protein [Flavobacteriales bacterium]|tara:strand:+ start:453 stop:1514 length:1062 start_codon:yes stop_codon:yes gene_type:complete
MMKKVDVIVVGQGLAGTLIAHDLIEARQSVVVIDVNLKASATRVAAGLINPVGMKRCIPSHNAHQYFPKAIERYLEIEQKLDTNFLEVKSILRMFANQEVKHDWQIKFSNTNMDRYISRLFEDNSYSFLNDNHGSAEVYPSAHIDLPTFLDKSREYFKSVCLLIEERFDFSQFNPKQGVYKSLQSNRVIFCEGFRVKDNPHFKPLPLTPTKGEVMTIRIPSLEYFDKIISKGVYILPLGNHFYLVGATYNHIDLTDEPTSDGQSFLKKKISEILSVEYEVISIAAGVRPTVKDRKTLIGLHPKYHKIGIFNGLGTRGALQGPLLSSEFSAVLVGNKKDTQNIDNQRFTRFFVS